MRQSAILLHISSLPGAAGIGTMGNEAFEFVDFLEAAGQHAWQILPLNPTGYGDSPYQSCSSFAGNPYLISLEKLVEAGLLQQSELDAVHWCDLDEKVDFGVQYHNKLKVLRLAYERFGGCEEFDSFCRNNGSWLGDYALFMALKTENGGKPWYEWEQGLKMRDPEAIWQARHRLEGEIRFLSFVQYLFFTQWEALHAYAKRKTVRIIGDVPIYVPLDSVDVWTEPELFELDESLTPTAVAGVPPDAFSEDGQLWGNPLYRWGDMEKNGFAWWIRRLGAAAKLYDMVRLDHFRGLESYWSVPFGDKTARNGKWIKGGGLPFIRAIRKALPELDLIAEDLGVITPEVEALREASGFPGMKVLEFAFGDYQYVSDYLPCLYEKNAVVYLGTHDNATALEWLKAAPAEEAAYIKEYMHLTDAEGMVWGMIRTAMSSVADLCVIQMQDYLGLGAEARMNFPGVLSGKNWTWRMKKGALTPALAEKIRRMTAMYCRTQRV